MNHECHFLHVVILASPPPSSAVPSPRFRGKLISLRTCRLPTPGVLPLLLTVKSSSSLLSLSVTLVHLSLDPAFAVVQAPSATAAYPRRSSTSSSQIVAAETPGGGVERDGEGWMRPRLRQLRGLIAELSEARKVDPVAKVVREMM
ncbi:hypothetical protein SASPL_143883 [Salvia splendens]|uniref:Uncharacterized protein n=1 Tax=Salvia splendens TaxID=180675 RepID=A0A8X8WP69_SALSN|nr:hypothetical protein SASPL_143883 [Salvia splendens]